MEPQKVPMNALVAKLAAVMAAVEHIPKRGKNTFHNYDYATEADIVSAVRKELATRHVMLVPQVDALEHQELAPKKNGDPREPLTILRMTFSFIDGETGDRIDRPWVGVGQDGGDKGVYKAMTGAAKYFLMKTFLMPTGDDPERSEKPEPGSASVKATASDRKARPPMSVEAKAAGAVYIEKVTPRSKGNASWSEVVFSTGETLFARGQLEALCATLANENCLVVVETKQTAKGKTELEMVRRWPPKDETDSDIDLAIAARDAVGF